MTKKTEQDRDDDRSPERWNGHTRYSVQPEKAPEYIAQCLLCGRSVTLKDMAPNRRCQQCGGSLLIEEADPGYSRHSVDPRVPMHRAYQKIRAAEIVGQ